jgi:hypothetical protein
MTTSDLRSRWLEAARILGDDASATVRCPQNGDGFLAVHDVVVDTGGDVLTHERHLHCPACGAHNAVLMRAPRGMGS